MTEDAILQLDDVTKEFDQAMNITDMIRNALFSESDIIRAVDDVTMGIERGEVQGVIGESGCGKTTLLKTIAGLHKPTSGDIVFKGESINKFEKEDWKAYRRNVQVIFQDPYNALDPKYTIGSTLAEPLQIHGIDDIGERIYNTLEEVQLLPPEDYVDRYPHELSGGEKQRVSIARALILEPDLILADEPVSMLDVSTQAAILQDLEKIVRDNNVSLMYISHDLSTVSYICDVVNVMYLGRIVESAPTEEILQDPLHPYTEALISAIPIPDPHSDRSRTEIEGKPGETMNIGEGCRFNDRCPESMEVCEITPDFVAPDDARNHGVACHLYYDHLERHREAAQTVGGSHE